MSVAGTQPSRGGSVLSASFNGRAPLAQRVGFSRGYPVSAKSQTLNLVLGFVAPPQLFLMVKVWGPGRQQCLLSLPPPAFLCWVWLWGICWGGRGGSYQKVLCQRAQLTCQQSPFVDELVRFGGSPPPPLTQGPRGCSLCVVCWWYLSGCPRSPRAHPPRGALKGSFALGVWERFSWRLEPQAA